MTARASWYRKGCILVFELQDPLILADFENGAEEVWALAHEVHDPVHLIFDYRTVSIFPRGVLPVVRDGHFMLPTLDRVALVGNEPLVEMMMTSLTRDTFRPDPTIHRTVDEAAQYLLMLTEESR